MPLDPEFKQIKAIIKLNSDSAANWLAANPIVPDGVMVYESDTGKAKIGDGVKTYSALPYRIDQALSEAGKALLDNAGGAGGVAVLGADGKVPASQLPDVLRGTIVYNQTIAERDLTPTEDREGRLFMVVDASADATVNAGAALYGWNPTLLAGAGDWFKIAEYESLDVDFNVFFNKETNTIDVIKDGVTHVRMTVEERAKLAGIEEGADVTDAENVAAAGAVMYTDTVLINGYNAAEMLAATTQE